MSDARQQFIDRYTRRTPGSLRLYEQARRHLPGGVPGNAGFRPPYPLYVDRAAGPFLWDVDGNRYIDSLIGGGPHILGHSPPPVMEAVARQLSGGTSTIAPSPNNLAMAEKIRTHMPHMEMIRFVHTGSEAVHMSMRVARAFTGRPRIGKFEGNFHGGYDNLLISGTSYAGPEERPVAVAEGAGTPRASGRHGGPAFQQHRRHRGAHRGARLGAGRGGVEAVGGTWMAGIVAEQGFLEALREVTARHGILLIFDEVITGFRVALGGSTAVTGVTPDLVALAKTIGGGFPMGAFGGRRDVMEQAVTPPRGPGDDRVTIFQSGTFQTNLVSLAAGLAMLSELEKPGVYEKLEETGEQVRRGIEKIGANLGLPVQATGQGPIFGVYFADEPVRTIRERPGKRPGDGRDLLPGSGGPRGLHHALSPGLHQRLPDRGRGGRGAGDLPVRARDHQRELTLLVPRRRRARGSGSG